MGLIEEFEKQGSYLFKRRGYLPILAFLPAFGIFVFQRIYLENPPLEEEYKFLSLIVSLLGLFVRIYAIGKTPERTSGRNTAEQIADVLNVKDVYSIVRHPLYLGNFFMWLGPVLLVKNVWFLIVFILAFWLYYERIMFAEESFLKNKFGEFFDSWSAKTPAFIPNFKLWRSGAAPFAFKKTLRREKTGVLALFFVFYLFDLADKTIENGRLFLSADFWSLAFAASAIFYLAVKFFVKK